ncbi:MAG TPA: acyltransferase family protein, partial [Candidatus Limnocylindria bacterium]
SPLLHFWSLAVEEQFYLFWPLILMGLARVFSVRHIWPAVVGIVVASYILTIVVAGIEAPWAFYSLPTRAWQLALGALVALGVLSLPAHWPHWLGSVLGLVGLGLIAEAVVVVDGTTPYGISGLLPAVGAALFIIGGNQTGAIPARLLATSVPRWFGRISYSLYLWHWPILILIPIIIGHGGLRVRVALALLSIVVAAASTRFIETPFRVRRWSTSSSRTLLVAAGCSVAIAFGAVATSGQFVRGTVGAPLPTLGAETAQQPPLPKPVLSGPLPDDLQPKLIDADRDRVAPGLEDCQSGLTDSDPRECVYGSDPSAPTVVILGDSHAAMWLPGMVALADDAPWRLVALTKPGCSPVLVTLWGRQLQRPSHECDVWRDLALQRIRELHPSIVFVTSSRNYQIADAEGNPVKMDMTARWYDGLVAVLDDLAGSADRVILIGETPHYPEDPVECLATHDLIEACIAPRSRMVSSRYQQLERTAAEAAGAALIEPIDWLCQERTCAPVMDHYLVYRNPGHLTATITTVLASQMRWAIEGLQ